MRYFTNSLTRIVLTGLITALLAAGCAGGQNLTPAPATQAPAGNTPEVAPPELGETQAAPAVTPATEGSSPDMPPMRDRPEASAVQLAVAQLASRMKVDPALISMVSSGEWTNDPVACQLQATTNQAIDSDRLKPLLDAQHQQILLSLKDKTYEVWVFQEVGGVPMAFICE